MTRKDTIFHCANPILDPFGHKKRGGRPEREEEQAYFIQGCPNNLPFRTWYFLIITIVGILWGQGTFEEPLWPPLLAQYPWESSRERKFEFLRGQKKKKKKPPPSPGQKKFSFQTPFDRRPPTESRGRGGNWVVLLPPLPPPPLFYQLHLSIQRWQNRENGKK